MRYKELADLIGVHHLKIVHARKKLFPDNSGELSDEEVEAIRASFKEDEPIERPPIMKVKVVHADSRYPAFVDAKIGETGEIILVQIPYGYDPQRFLGREILVESIKAEEGNYIFKYNPWIDG